MPTFTWKKFLIFSGELNKKEKFPDNGASGYVNQCLIYFYWDLYSENMVQFIGKVSLISKSGK